MIYSPHPSSPAFNPIGYPSTWHSNAGLKETWQQYQWGYSSQSQTERKDVWEYTCRHTRTQAWANWACGSEGRTEPWASREYWVSEGMSLCGKCQLKRWGHFFFSTFPVWHLLHNGPFNSRWCLGIFRWGQFERLCWRSRYNETQLGDKPWWTGWSERRHWHWMCNMHWWPCGVLLTPVIRGCWVCCFCSQVNRNKSDCLYFKMFLTSFFTCLSW